MPGMWTRCSLVFVVNNVISIAPSTRTAPHRLLAFQRCQGNLCFEFRAVIPSRSPHYCFAPLPAVPPPQGKAYTYLTVLSTGTVSVVADAAISVSTRHAAEPVPARAALTASAELSLVSYESVYSLAAGGVRLADGRGQFSLEKLCPHRFNVTVPVGVLNRLSERAFIRLILSRHMMRASGNEHG
jgi:hypothetical protein